MKRIAFILLGLLLIIACSDDNESSSQGSPEPDGQENQEVPKIADNVVVISDDSSDVVSTETDLEAGLYILEYTGDVETVVINDIIVGDEDEGFLRKVNTVTVSGNVQTMETEQATFEDVFENADISFNLDLANLDEVTNKGYPIVSNEIIVDYLAKGVSVNTSNGFSFDMNSTEIATGALSFTVTGNAAFNPNFNFDAEIRAFSIQSVVFEANNANLSLSAGYELNASGSVSTSNEVRLVRLRKRFTFVVGTVPVVVTADVRLDASLNTTLDAEFVASGSYNKTYTVDTGIRFEDGQWTSNFNTGETTSIDPLNYNGTVNLTEVLNITPNVQLKFYGVVAPFVEPEMFAEYKMNTSVTAGDWDATFDVGLNLTTGVKATIFGRTLFNFDRTDTFTKNLWDAPKLLEIVSGNMQEGDEETELEEPLKVKVTDNLGNPVNLAQVNIALVNANGEPSTSGSVDFEKIETDEEGIAEFIWTLGKEDDEDGTTRFVELQLKDSEGAIIEQDEPVVLEAEIKPSTGCGSDFVDLSLFTPTDCGQVFNINDVFVSAEITDVDDCGEGACSFINNGVNGIRIMFDIGVYQELAPTEIIIKYIDFSCFECSKAFVYDENNVLLATMTNTVTGEEAEFRFEGRELVSQARFVAFSSCEGDLLCFGVK